MIPVNLLNALKEYTATQKMPLPVAATDQVTKTEALFEPGQKFQGIVLAQVAPNIFKVNVSGKLVQMELPSTVKSGDTVPLQVISLQPRLTFSMVNSAPPLATAEQLGSTARILSALSQQAPEKAYVRAAQSAPLWQTAHPPEVKQLAGKLQEALSNSGLFYESHQAQWLGGERSTAQLMHEPQNLAPEQARVVTSNMPAHKVPDRISDLPGESHKSSAEKVTLANDASHRIVTTGNHSAQDGVNSDTPVSTASNPLSATAVADGKSLGIPEHLQPLVQQQLNALETRQMIWQGAIWPQQEMKWEVHEHVPQSGNADEQQQWVTRIQLDLPNLGPVSATLRFNSAGLSLVLDAGTEHTRSLLGSASSGLLVALKEAGISVLGTQVKQ
jgi:hypothetical protein